MSLDAPQYDTASLPYKVAVLCYLWDGDDRLLMLHRRKPPNVDMYSPVGGKVEISRGESPHECAVREVHEETGLLLGEAEVRLMGMVSERAYQGQMHWLIFLFECVRPVGRAEIPLREFDEGRLEWVAAADVERLPIPATDRDVMWPLVQAHRGGGFFGVDIDCSVEPMVHRVRESRPMLRAHGG
ncbi:MAG: NUDIX domain-containing protein [Phycisphaerales bacterium]|nr:NUDIX domain-containing protein [Phycisphaerales bacterium]